jgi:hypothetical protein
MDALQSTIGTNPNQEKPASKPSMARLAVDTKEACYMLGGVNRVTLFRLEKRGLLKPIPHLRHKLWPVSMLKKFVEGGLN